MVLASKLRSASSKLTTSLSSLLSSNSDWTSQVAATPDLYPPFEEHVSVEISRLQVPSQQKVRTNDANPELETHYVLVVHGTFVKSNEPGKVKWHHPDPTGEQNNFCGRLAALLAEGPLGSECVWRALPGAKAPSEVTYPFYWDASNTDQGRQQGGQNLAKLIKHIGKVDPSARVHIIAHSHGGNVALKAIEQYIRKLEPESTMRHWPTAIREQFEEEHREQVAHLRKWRRVEGVSCCGALNPFLVVWRGANGEKHTTEQFAWGYYHWWDWCLGLGRRRKRKYLSRRRMISPISNVLGKVVFLGTPFYYKHWAKRARFKLTVSLTFSFLLGYLITFTATSIWVGLFQTDHYSLGLVSWISGVIAIFLFVAHLASWAERTLLRSGNMYHSDKVPWSPAMHALVVQAGKLDEAALALCTEPAARAYLLPLVKRATSSLGWVPFPRFPRRGARLSKWALFFLIVLRSLLINALDLIPRTILWGVGKLVVIHTFGTLRKILVGAAFGLDTENLNKASVYAAEKLTLGGSFRDIHTWDVRRILAEAEELSCGWKSSFSTSAFVTGSRGSPSSTAFTGSSNDGGGGFKVESLPRGGRLQPEMFEENSVDGESHACVGNGCNHGIGGTSGAGMPTDVVGSRNDVRLSSGGFESRYAFLWDEEKLMELSDSSWMFNKLKKQLRKVDHSPFISDAEFERELRSICCVFEQRLSEVRGHFQLAHSTYYKNTAIIEAVVGFLERLDLPK
ncbi:hypothetical protein KFL_000950130 [Klebsormidium nitens]|uniref:Uncharacterized protein n=1 Tax=Klebsormidium nitens TaxID=105231 RepID=A0A1Y1HZI1_KLENI|nr:hypothetical protein KFL_000950130 [Klebsormidium nitens]|eukprot:GAQ81937.1 hypothetical protein KFL_000950130 [Klebsormidium nitens]